MFPNGGWNLIGLLICYSLGSMLGMEDGGWVLRRVRHMDMVTWQLRCFQVSAVTCAYSSIRLRIYNIGVIKQQQ